MSTFTDLNNDEWTIALNFGAIDACRVKAKVEFANMAKVGESWAKMIHDDQTALHAVWLLVEGEAKARNVDRAEFDSRMDGNTLEGALQAIKDAVLNFARAGNREVLTKAFEKVEASYASALIAAGGELDRAFAGINERFAAQGV